jgi:hypothetical protein
VSIRIAPRRGARPGTRRRGPSWSRSDAQCP